MRSRQSAIKCGINMDSRFRGNDNKNTAVNQSGSVILLTNRFEFYAQEFWEVDAGIRSHFPEVV